MKEQFVILLSLSKCLIATAHCIEDEQPVTLEPGVDGCWFLTVEASYWQEKLSKICANAK